MAAAVIMPRQGQSVESCILTEWYKSVGDQVSQGDLLFAYETDKASFEEEAQADGILLVRFYEEGDEVPVLVNVAVIGEEGESANEFRPGGTVASSEAAVEESHGGTVASSEAAVEESHGGTVASSEAAVEESPGTPQQVARMPQDSNGRVAISPRAKKLAREKRVVVEAITGTGPGGRIIERDILEEIRSGKRLTPLAKRKMEEDGLVLPVEGKAPFGKITSKDLVEASQFTRAPEQVASSGAYTEIPLSNVRKIIAGAMYRSLRNSAQLTHHLSANASNMLQLRKEVKNRIEEGYTFNITLNDMVCFAVIRALKLHPEANAHFLDEKIRQYNQVNLGLAIDTDRGLLVPALLHADDLSLPGLSSQLKDLVEVSRQGNVSPDLLAPEAATFTVSNLGNYGVEMFTPVINLPQVAILGVNTIIQRPTTLADGSFGFQPFIGLSLTYDHRAIDGGPATQFLAGIRNQIEKLSPELL